LIAPLWSLPEAERLTHFEMPANTDDAEMDVVLSMLAGESSDSTHTEPMAITTGQGFDEEVETRKPEGAHPKRPCRMNHPITPVEEKKKRRLRRLSCLDQDAGPSVPILDDVPADAHPKVAKICDNAQTTGGMFDEDEEEKEEEISLIRKNSRFYRGSEGVAIFPLQLCWHLSVFRGFQYQILIKHWRKSFLKKYYRSLLKMISQLSVQKSQMVGFYCLVLLGKK
jgi:hypothetical protein